MRLSAKEIGLVSVSENASLFFKFLFYNMAFGPYSFRDLFKRSVWSGK